MFDDMFAFGTLLVFVSGAIMGFIAQLKDPVIYRVLNVIAGAFGETDENGEAPYELRVYTMYIVRTIIAFVVVVQAQSVFIDAFPYALPDNNLSVWIFDLGITFMLVFGIEFLHPIVDQVYVWKEAKQQGFELTSEGVEIEGKLESTGVASVIDTLEVLTENVQSLRQQKSTQDNTPLG